MEQVSAEKKSGIWLWIVLAIFIFVLYCLSMQRPYCMTLDQAGTATQQTESIVR